jgi:hypothetical protein
MPQPVPPGPYTPPQFADPHVRTNPTVTGGRLNLAPYEVPADRVIELTKQMEIILAQNAVLQSRIKELESLAMGREQALAEAMREVETVTALAAKERATFQAQIDTLQGKIKQLEEEDIIFLRAVIDALGKLFPEKKP